jgi:hypothetical protein
MADYGRLAALMGTHQELALFRKFARLNAKNLLYMQSELMHLEVELENVELENGGSGDPEKMAFIVSLFDLKDSSGTENDLQWRKVLEVREKLNCYSTSTSNPSDIRGELIDLLRWQTKLFSAMPVLAAWENQVTGMLRC